LIVTTTLRPSAALEARAALVAARTGWPLVPRRAALARLRQEHGAAVCYVVGSQRDELQSDADALFVHPGLFYLKRDTGLSHPLIRSVAPSGGRPPIRVVDATLGLGGDALHLAWALGTSLIGLEASPVIYSLLEEGLARMASTPLRGFADPASRVHPVLVDALQWLAEQPAGSADVVYLDPMFETPLSAPPGFELFRGFAHAVTLSEELVEAACRVASARVVIKIPGASQVPDFRRFDGRVRGGAVDYLVVEHELDARGWDAPNPGDPDRQARRAPGE